MGRCGTRDMSSGSWWRGVIPGHAMRNEYRGANNSSPSLLMIFQGTQSQRDRGFDKTTDQRREYMVIVGIAVDTHTHEGTHEDRINLPRLIERPSR